MTALKFSKQTMLISIPRTLSICLTSSSEPKHFDPSNPQSFQRLRAIVLCIGIGSLLLSRNVFILAAVSSDSFKPSFNNIPLLSAVCKDNPTMTAQILVMLI